MLVAKVHGTASPCDSSAIRMHHECHVSEPSACAEAVCRPESCALCTSVVPAVSWVVSETVRQFRKGLIILSRIVRAEIIGFATPSQPA